MKRFNIKAYAKAFEEFKELEIISAGAYPKGHSIKRIVTIADTKSSRFLGESIELSLTIYNETIKADIRLKSPTIEQEEYLSDKVDFISEGGFNDDIRKTYHLKERFREHEEAISALKDFCKLYYKDAI
ncbi:hypothetical protein [Campylobacter sp. RM12651]|uniref:hypothetical protein n=1 Tax=Campylobacter sp. RM12651 TaxID=1660079 RepID=UPI001EFB1493|nr:hypothetical protein [Campylobacter sp. RM12651]ULO02937.1 hypothetical protein AVBRAN_0467 [Campylobacter sp. RM12651]